MGYPAVVREVAKTHDVFLIDLHAMSKALYQALGPDLGKAFQDGSHHNSYGAYELAKCVASALAKSDLPLASKVTEAAAAFMPGLPDPWQDFDVPPSTDVDLEKPEGD